MKKILENILGAIAKRIVKKYKPTIIGITGSAGKTSAKEAVYAAMTPSYSVRPTAKNYNNEIGLPLTIIGGKAAGKNVFSWLIIFARGMSYLIYPRRYPRFLVLEMGADRPGDIAKLVAIAPPAVSVVTSLGAAHMEYFGSLGAIAEEKETIIHALPADGWAVLNADDPRVIAMAAATKAKVMTFGFCQTADVRAKEVNDLRDPRSGVVLGMKVTVVVNGSSYTLDLMGVTGKGHVLAALAGLAVAKLMRVTLAKAVEGLKAYKPAPGRMRLLPGIKNTVIIDDSYNASPAAMEDALNVLKNYPVLEKNKRIAILGDMRELGGLTESSHADVGQKIAAAGIDLFIGVGEAMNDACEAAKRAGVNEDRAMHMENAISAGRFVQDKMRQGDAVLIKGSQSLRMERAVKELMAEPERAEDLLCRQGREWEK